MNADLLGPILVLFMLAIMAARAVPVMAAPLNGKIELEVPVPLVFRLLDQRVNIIAILAVLILGSGLIGERWISHELFLFALVATIGILLFQNATASPQTGSAPAARRFGPGANSMAGSTAATSSDSSWLHSGTPTRKSPSDW